MASNALRNFGESETRLAPASPPSAYSLVESRIEKGTHLAETKSGNWGTLQGLLMSSGASRRRREAVRIEDRIARIDDRSTEHVNEALPNIGPDSSQQRPSRF